MGTRYRGKRGLAIDLKTERGRELFGRLLGTADVLLTNWLPGALERAGLTVDDIRRCNPKIIVARGTGLGVRGPDSDQGGFDGATYLARGGVAYTLTPFGAEYPAIQGPAFGDLQAGATLAGGVCAALFHRERTGETTIVDSSLLARRCGRPRRRCSSPTSSAPTASPARRRGSRSILS